MLHSHQDKEEIPGKDNNLDRLTVPKLGKYLVIAASTDGGEPREFALLVPGQPGLYPIGLDAPFVMCVTDEQFFGALSNQLPADNVTCLRLLREKLPELFTSATIERLRSELVEQAVERVKEDPDAWRFKHVDRSFDRLMAAIADSTASPDPSSHIGVVVTSPSTSRTIFCPYVPKDYAARLDEQFETLMENHAHRKRIFKYSEASITAGTERMRDALSDYQWAFDFDSAGFQAPEIAKLLEVDETTVRAWLRGGRPHAITSRAPSRVSKPFEAPVVESSDFAYFVGAWCGRAGGSEIRNGTITFSAVEPETVNELARRLPLFASELNVRVYREKTKSGPLMWHLSVSSRELAASLHDITQGKETLPWEHLGSKSESVQFVNGFLDFRGSVNASRGIYAAFDADNKLINDVAVLLFRLGVTPWIGSGSVQQLRVGDRSDVVKLVELGWKPTDLGDQKGLAEYLSRSIEDRHHGTTQYALALGMLANGELTLREVAEKLEISERTLQKWKSGTRIPFAERRRRELLELEGSTPRGEVAAYLFRTRRLDRQTARELSIGGTLDGSRG